MNDTEQEVDRIAAQARQAVASIRNSSTADSAAVTGEGESEDGYVQLVLRGDGSVATLTISPRALRGGSEAVQTGVAEAIEAAHKALQANLASADGPLEQLRTFTESVTGQHGSLGSYIQKATAELKENLSRSQEALERIRAQRPDVGRAGPSR